MMMYDNIILYHEYLDRRRTTDMAREIIVDGNQLKPGVQIRKKGCGVDICDGNKVLEHIKDTDIASFAEALSTAQIAHKITTPDLVITIVPAEG